MSHQPHNELLHSHEGSPLGPVNAVFATSHAFRHNPVAFVNNLKSAYGDVVRLHFGERDLFLLNRPEFVYDVFVGKSQTFAKRIDEKAETEYLNQIGGFVPFFAPDKVPGYASAMTEAATRASDRWAALSQEQAAPLVDIYREIMRITLEIEAKTIFGTDVAALGEDTPALVEAMLAPNVGYGFNTIEAILGGLMPPPSLETSPETEPAHRLLTGFAQRMVEARRGAPDGTFLDILIKYLPADQVVAQTLADFFAMHEVTATTLPWAWYLLAQYPEVEDRLLAELSGVLAGRPATLADAPNLPYTEMVLAETRRLYPSVWLVGRFVREEVSFGGNTVPAGSVVLMSQAQIQRDPCWFPNPDQFDPSRWTPEAVAARQEFSYFPFSAGPRKCAGEEFAKLQDVLLLATLAQQWQARLEPSRLPIEPVPQRSFAPRYGIPMRLRRR